MRSNTQLFINDIKHNIEIMKYLPYTFNVLLSGCSIPLTSVYTLSKVTLLSFNNNFVNVISIHSCVPSYRNYDRNNKSFISNHVCIDFIIKGANHKFIL